MSTCVTLLHSHCPDLLQVWRREKSLPNFYDKPVLKEESGAETSRPSRNVPPPNIVRYIRELSEQRKTVDTRQSVDSTQRYRSKLHPKADFSFEGWSVAEHQQDLIPSFIPRQERTKTTLGDESVGGGATAAAAAAAAAVSGGGGSGVVGGVVERPGGHAASGTLGREVSNLMAAYTRDKPLQQQQVCLTGGKMSLTNLGRHPLLYLKPFSAYRHRQTYNHVNAVRTENMPASFSPRHAVSLSLSPRGSGALGMVTSSANGQPLQRRDLVLSGSSFHAPERAPLQPLRVSQKSPHKFNSKLGAAQDSLLMLSRTGAPTVLERNLSFDQEVRLERCRRERSFAAISDSNILSTTHYVSYDSQPTRGEIILMKAREANKSRDGSKVVYRRNGLQKPFGSVPPFGQNHASFMMGRALDNSPRSVKSELGDSGIMSSPGENGDETARAGDMVAGVGAYPRDLGDEPIPEHPGDCDEQGEELQTAALQMWAPADSVAVLHGDVGSDFVVESTDEYRRPLSDSAATETVHVRNELTPLSAENKARMLPRDGSYVEAMEAEGGRLSHRHYRQGFVRDATPPPTDRPARSSAQEPTQTESGAETVSKDSDTSKSNDAEAPTLPPQRAESGQLRSVKAHDKTSVASDSSADADSSAVADTSEMDSQSTTAAEGDPAFSVVKVDSPRSEKMEGVPSGKTSRENGGDRAQTAADLELVSVTSCAPSHGDPDSARDPASQHPPTGTVAGEHRGEERGARAADPENKPEASSSGSDGTAAGDVTPRPTTGNRGDGLDEDRPAPTADKGQVPEAAATEGEGSSAGLPVGYNKAKRGPEASSGGASAARDVDTDTLQAGVLDSERNVSKTTPRSPGNTQEGAGPADGSAGPESCLGDSTSGENGPVTARKDDSFVDDDSVQPSQVKPEDVSDAVMKDGIQREDELKTGVEAIVTVTMETVQTEDNFDGSKTFLTTSTVEPEEWQNMVKV